jgi:hypothetical protein
LSGAVRASLARLLLPGNLVVDFYVVEARRVRTLDEAYDLAARRERLPLSQWPNLSGLEMPRSGTQDARPLAVHRSSVEEDDVEGVSVLLGGRFRRHLQEG